MMTGGIWGVHPPFLETLQDWVSHTQEWPLTGDRFPASAGARTPSLKSWTTTNKPSFQRRRSVARYLFLGGPLQGQQHVVIILHAAEKNDFTWPCEIL